MSKYISGFKNQFVTVSSSGSITNTSSEIPYFQNGSASAPSITFSSDTNTGIYRINTDTLGFTTNGLERLRINADGSFRFGGYDLNESLDISSYEIIQRTTGGEYANKIITLGQYIYVRKLPGATLSRSVDFGENFTVSNNNFINLLNFAASGTKILTIGDNSNVKVSLNRGATWELLSDPSENFDLNSVNSTFYDFPGACYISPDGDYFIVGARDSGGNLIVFTSTSPETNSWTEVNTGIDATLNMFVSIACTNLGNLVVGLSVSLMNDTNGEIVRYNGTTWSSVPIPDGDTSPTINPNPVEICISDNGVYQLFVTNSTNGYKGRAFRSTDSGQTFTQILTGPFSGDDGFNFNACSMDSTGEYQLLSTDLYIYFSNNYGVDWNSIYNSTGIIYSSISKDAGYISFIKDSDVYTGTDIIPAPNKLNIASQNRTNRHSTDTVLYVTGADQKLIETRLSDASQGLRIGYNSIAASGNDTNQDIIINPKGIGTVLINDNQGIELDENSAIMAYGTNSNIDLSINSKGNSGVIFENGNVGIGTTSPQYKLSCANTNNKVCFYAADENQTMTLFLGTPIASGVDTNAMKSAIIAEGIADWSRSKLHFCLENTSGDNSSAANVALSDSKMTIVPSGNVGIQNISPIGTLSLGNVETSNVDGCLTIAKNNGSGGVRQVRFAYSDLDFVIGDYGGTNNNAQSWIEHFKINYQAPANSLFIKSNGDIGIGTDTPTAKLHINNGNLKQSRLDYVRTNYIGILWPGNYNVTYTNELVNNLSGYITYYNNMTFGDNFVINKSGIYSITASFVETGTGTFWIDKNTPAATNYPDVVVGNLLTWNSNTSSGAEFHSITWTGFLDVSDSIQIKSNIDTDATSVRAMLCIVLINEC